MNDDRKAALRRLLDQPFIGFGPWIVLAVVEGPGRVVLASALACLLALLLAAAGAVAGLRPKLLDLTAIGFFGALTLVAALASPAVRHWLGLWAGELSNAAIAAIAVASIVARRPFTLEYARETTDPEYWDSPLFLEINYAISGVWAVVFLITAIVGYIGDGPLHQPDNIWTNWIIEIALFIVAIKFTRWYPDYATAAAGPSNGAQIARTRPGIEMLRPLAGYLIPVGIVVLILGGAVWWIGAALTALGVVTTRYLRKNDATVTPTHDHGST
jgi:hypothetical protein